MTAHPELSELRHKDALLRRRIKFVVEKGSMARLFRKGTSKPLKQCLFKHLQPHMFASFTTREEYDAWLARIVN